MSPKKDLGLKNVRFGVSTGV